MTARLPVGIHATSEKALAYRPNAQALPAAVTYGTIGSHRAMNASYEPDEPDLEEAEEPEDVAELLAARPVHPSGKWVGIGVDACDALIELQKLIGELDFFSPGDTGLGRLQQASERANVILQRAGYRNGNAA
jgi:hypothetical protein